MSGLLLAPVGVIGLVVGRVYFLGRNKAMDAGGCILPALVPVVEHPMARPCSRSSQHTGDRSLKSASSAQFEGACSTI